MSTSGIPGLARVNRVNPTPDEMENTVPQHMESEFMRGNRWPCSAPKGASTNN